MDRDKLECTDYGSMTLDQVQEWAEQAGEHPGEFFRRYRS